MKTRAVLGLLLPLTAFSQPPTPLPQFQDKLGNLPSLSLRPAPAQPPLAISSLDAPTPAQPSAPPAVTLHHPHLFSRMPVLVPSADVDPRMPIKAPDPSVDYKMIVVDPGVALQR